MTPRGSGLRLLGRLLAPHRRRLTVLAAWTAVEATPAFIAGLLIAKALDHGFLAGRPLIGLGWLTGFAAAYGLAALATRRVYPLLAAVVEPLRDTLLNAVVTACVRRATSDPDGADGTGIAQATEQVETVRDMLSTLLRNARQFVAAVVAIAGLAVLSPWLALAVAPPFALALLGAGWFLRGLVVRQRRATLAGEQLTHRARPVIDGVRDVVAAGAESVAATDVDSAIGIHADAVRAFARARSARVLLLALGVQLPLLGVLAASPWLIDRDLATVGAIGGAVVYLSQQLEPAVRFLLNAAGTWLVVLGVVLGRLAEVTTGPAPVPDRHRRRPPGRHDLRLAAVTFAYSEHADPVLSRLCLDIPAGTHLAVVGPSGVGKSTLANLIAGILTPRHGEIRFGGVPLADLDERELRRDVAMIPQEAYVFAGTVRDNLGYLCAEPTPADLDRVVALLGLKSTVDRLGGYDARIPVHGSSLSAGERQLLALARVYLSPAEVVILDEATSNLDPIAEARVETAFAARPGTLIVIAHRISSAARADRILLLDGSRTALGSHRDLLAGNPCYADLVGHWNTGRDDSPPVDGTHGSRHECGVELAGPPRSA